MLVDAGAGDSWKFNDVETQKQFGRSEGLAIAAFHFFKNFGCSSNKSVMRADAEGLESITSESFAKAFQVSDSNILVGLDGRTDLLKRLGNVLKGKPEYFQSLSGDCFRPGNILDYLLNHPSTVTKSTVTHVVQITTLWEVVMKGFAGVWPEGRSKLDGVALGDVWPCKALENIAGTIRNASEKFLPFHKLSQWLTYSLMEPLSIAGITFSGVESMTGLPEYRNGGLLVDLEILTLKQSVNPGPYYPQDDVIVEWRGLTVALLGYF